MTLNRNSAKLPIANPRSWGAAKRILVMSAVPAERDAVIRGLNGDTRFDVMLAGVGPASAAASTARQLATAKYDLVISAGIGGGFPGKAELGSLVVANEIVAADLGVETPEGFKSLEELGFGSTRMLVDPSLVELVTGALHALGRPVCSGPVLTVSTVTGTAASARELSARVVGATAEAMEGYGVAIAAQACRIPILEIRAISNAVGPRDRDSWQIKEALEALAAACKVIAEVIS